MLQKVSEMYKAGFFKGRHRDRWTAELLGEAIWQVFRPKSVVDVGCAIGSLLDVFQKHGTEIFGIEGAETVEPYLVIHKKYVLFADLRLPLNLNRRFELATSIEVAEHIESQFADLYVQNLVDLSDTLLISAAPPGQKGHYHVNCQELSYWTALFEKHGYVRDKKIVDAVLSHLGAWKRKKGMAVYWRNLVCYVKERECCTTASCSTMS